MRRALILSLVLGACTQFPQLDNAVTDDVRNADYPALIPVEPLLARSNAQGASPQETQQALESRVSALRARAARLRGTTVVDSATRRRMNQGAG